MARAPAQSGFIFLLYLMLRIVLSPLLVLYFLHRGIRDARYFTHFRERWGTLPRSFQRTAPDAVWLHAVSVGEVVSSVRLIEELRAANPLIPIYLSTTTVAGRAVADQKAAALVDGVFYAPLDFAFAVRRVLRTIRPAVLVVLETEIWPVLYREVKRAGCALIVLNGRISDRALPRYRRFRWAFAPVLHLPDLILVQSETDRLRYLEAGAPSAQVAGNLKFDAAPVRSQPHGFVLNLIERMRPAQVWIAASTMPGLDAADVDEDDAVIAAFRQVAAGSPGLLLILVPRKPERFSSAAEKLHRAGIPFGRRSEAKGPAALPGVLLLDTLGELAGLFPLADVVFMGGTLARRGGHNVLEPASCGKPVVVGPHMENFGSIAEGFRERAAWLQIGAASELAPAILKLLGDPNLRHELGARGATLAAASRGLAAKAAQEILAAQDAAVPAWRTGGVFRPFLWAANQAWNAGSRFQQARDVAHARALDTPVISVGGIAMGGTGKTPFVEMLARLFRPYGTPGILTRGYRRQSRDRCLLVQAGDSAPAWQTGDEAQIFVRSGVAHVGIGPDRWQVGRSMEQRFHPRVFLLDDGFQHRRLKRDLDIVLIDALDPFPLWRMREPVEALARAGIFVITRAQPGRAYSGIRARLRAVNPNAPIFLARVEPREWAQVAGPVLAFCGLGNPATFWETLRRQGIAIAATRTFADHHRYSPADVRALRRQAAELGATLVTTEKDAMNLPDGAGDGIAALRITTAVDQESELLELLLRVLSR